MSQENVELVLRVLGQGRRNPTVLQQPDLAHMSPIFRLAWAEIGRRTAIRSAGRIHHVFSQRGRCGVTGAFRSEAFMPPPVSGRAGSSSPVIERRFRRRGLLSAKRQAPRGNPKVAGGERQGVKNGFSVQAWCSPSVGRLGRRAPPANPGACKHVAPPTTLTPGEVQDASSPASVQQAAA